MSIINYPLLHFSIYWISIFALIIMIFIFHIIIII